jgi:UDP-N-acetylmuramate dehydrogenase
MINYQEHISLKPFNTFGLDVEASKYFRYSEAEELVEYLKLGNLNNSPFLVLGGGSNLLFVSDFNGIVIHSGILGIDVVDESPDGVVVAAGAGVEWDHLVAWSVEQGLSGIENLSLIPGSVGASPVQNIGAYGVELKDVFFKAEGIYIETGEPFTISAQGCEFDYRYSVFKGPLKNKVVITRVLFKLSRKPSLKLEYGSVMDEVQKLGGPSLQNIRKAIIQIRSSKLPDPAQFGNAGSFFKNPMVNRTHFLSLKERFADMPFYETGDANKVKIPAGWLVEKAGWKGKSKGRAGVHHQQALVLVNLGGATGQEIVDLALEIESDVQKIFGVSLEKEVNVIG